MAVSRSAGETDPARPRTVTRRGFLQAGAGSVTWAAGVSGEAQSSTSRAAKVVVFHDPGVLAHVPREGHPERPARMAAVLAGLRALESTHAPSQGVPRRATDDDLLRVHTTAYLALVKAEIGQGRSMLSTGDTEISPGSLEAARGAAGCVLAAVDAVMSGPTRRAFCAIRPPGHHASAARGMGFCVFNNLAVGVRHAQARYGVERVLVVDWDVHHGNGTQDVFWRDGSVLFFDTHQHPWYPGTGMRNEAGEGNARGLILNRPLPAGSGRREVLSAFREDLMPAAERFKPQLVMLSAGFDSRVGDPLGQFTLSDQDFADLTTIVCEIARQFAESRVVSVLEGGYALDGLTGAVRAHVASLAAP